jgi:hypothetical protein
MPLENDGKSRSAILVLTHFCDDRILRFFERVRAEVPANHDVYLAINLKTESDAAPAGSEAAGDALFLTSDERLVAMGYREKCRPEGYDGTGWIHPGNADLVPILFTRAHPEYDQIWSIEYDVHFEGNWGVFFDHFAPSSAHLIATTLHNAADTADNVMDPPFLEPDGKSPDLAKCVRGFFPLYRVSREALGVIDREYGAGWGGHYEMVLGTLLSRAGMEIEDIGGNGPYVKPENRNRFYFASKHTYTKSPGTFVFRPAFHKVMKRPNTLWHPVKPPGNYTVWYTLRNKGGLAKNALEAAKPRIWWSVIWLWFAFIWRPLKTPKP